MPNYMCVHNISYSFTYTYKEDMNFLGFCRIFLEVSHDALTDLNKNFEVQQIVKVGVFILKTSRKRL